MGEYASYPSLKDRVVFITGGASGIGESLVEHFCAQRAKVAFVDILAEQGNRLADAIAEKGDPKPLFLECDIRDIPGLQGRIREAGETLGPITILVNNAANDTRHKIEDVTVEYWDERIAINLRPYFFAAQAVHPQMKGAGGGAIVNMGSFTYLRGEGGFPGYSASKAGIHGLTRGLARDFGPDNIRVNTMMPGWIMTKRQLELWVDEAGEREIFEKQCLKDKVYPPDVARMVLFLAADDGRMCSAQQFIVDGGWV